MTRIGALAFMFCVSLSSTFDKAHGDTLTIEEDFIYEGQYANREDITEVRIPNTVQSIPENAFANCKNLKTVYIHPAYQLNIKHRAFGNTGIERVIFTDETFERPYEYMETVHLAGAAITGPNIQEIILGGVRLTGGATTTGIMKIDYNRPLYTFNEKITLVSDEPSTALSGHAIFWGGDFNIISSYEHWQRKREKEDNEKTQKLADTLDEWK